MTTKIRYWNFRLVDNEGPNDGMSLIEAYYDKKDRLVAWCPASAAHIKEDGKMMAKAFKRPVLKATDLPGSDEPSDSKVHLLYGVADRDSKELVGMFFNNTEDMKEFVGILPGHYRTMVLEGIAKDFNIRTIRDVKAS